LKRNKKGQCILSKAINLDIERMAEAGDQYAQACLGDMYDYGDGVD